MGKEWNQHIWVRHQKNTRCSKWELKQLAASTDRIWNVNLHLSRFDTQYTRKRSRKKFKSMNINISLLFNKNRDPLFKDTGGQLNNDILKCQEAIRRLNSKKHTKERILFQPSKPVNMKMPSTRNWNQGQSWGRIKAEADSKTYTVYKGNKGFRQKREHLKSW